MSSGHTVVTADLGLRFVLPGSPPVPIAATIRYDVADPYAVHVNFHTGADDSAVEWTFARQLLADGATRPMGEGDVKIWPTQRDERSFICLALSSPSGSALFETSLTEIVEFLTRSYSAVPTGCESHFVDLDTELALLLWSE